MTTKSNKDYSVLRYYLNKPRLGELKKIINHFKQLVKNESKTLSIENALNALISKNIHQYSGKNNNKKKILRQGLVEIAKLNKEGNDNEIDIYEWILFNKYMDLDNYEEKKKFLENSQKKINGLKEDRSYNVIRKNFILNNETKYEEYLTILENFKSNIKAKNNNKKGVNFDNKPNTVLPLQKLYENEANKNLTSARSIYLSTVRTLTSREGLEATNRISEQMRDVRSELINKWNDLYKNFKEMYENANIILNKQSIPTKDFEIYLKNPICKSQNISQKNINKFINLQGQTEQKEVLYKVNKIILLCRYVNELYCIIGNFKDKLKNEKITIANNGIAKLKKIIEDLLKINTKDNTDTLDINDIDSICENIKDILDNFKKVIKGIKSDLDVPFIKDNFVTVKSLPRLQKPTGSLEGRHTTTKPNSQNFKDILKQINANNTKRLSKKFTELENEKNEFNLSKIFVKSNGQDIEKSKQYLEIMLDFYSIYDNKNRPIIKNNLEHQAFIQKLRKKLIDILKDNVILNIELLKYNFLDATKVYEEIIREIKEKNTNRKK